MLTPLSVDYSGFPENLHFFIFIFFGISSFSNPPPPGGSGGAGGRAAARAGQAVDSKDFGRTLTQAGRRSRGAVARTIS